MKTKLKRLITMILSATIFSSLCLFSVSALRIDNGTGFYYEYIDKTTATIVGYYRSDVNVVVPDSIYDKKVVKITANTFGDNETIQSIVLPNTVTTLEEFAFSNCTSLKNIKLSSSITEISFLMFGGCTSLETVYVPKSVTDISEYAFYDTGDFTMLCQENSYAQEFAIKNNIKYEIVPEYLLGDVDNDGVISISDATYIQLHIAKLSQLGFYESLKADTDQDSKINISDATKIQQWLTM